MSWTKQDAKKLSDQILSFSKAPECEVALAETSLDAHALRRERDHDLGRGARPFDLDHEPRRGKERDASASTTWTRTRSARPWP